jgi:hypothetical protein
MTRNLTFIKNEYDKWYVVLPDYKGDKENLEMVMGADTFLDIIAQGEKLVTMTFSTDSLSNYKYHLKLLDYEHDGANYLVISDLLTLKIWLCSVTKFVFGDYPQDIFCL